jgi:GT2 family glycosyltransferase
MKYKASVVIPNFNGLWLLKTNLPLVVKALENEKNNIDEIVVVDDASTDDSISYIKSKYPNIRIVKHTKNRGFPASVNTGVRSAKNGLVVLLNTDVGPSNNFLNPTLKHFKDDSVFAVSFHEKGYGYAKGRFKNGFIVHDPGKEVNKTSNTFWASGGSAVFRRSIWVKLGGMDEKLFTPYYWEDVDLSYRAAKRGYKILWEPNSKVVHKHGSTISKISKRRRSRIQQRNQLLFIWKNLTSTRLFKKHLSGLTKYTLRHPGYFIILLSALLKARTVMISRKKEKKETKVSDEAIFASFS